MDGVYVCSEKVVGLCLINIPYILCVRIFFIEFGRRGNESVMGFGKHLCFGVTFMISFH